ncbi:MAG: hypothetical protein IKW51_08620 [Bacteroidales bacterium]|nr:hypothetical protein [Bacteroidales bacterium]
MFKKGDSVEVINKRLQSFGLIGTITCSHHNANSSFVSFDNWNGKGEKELLIKNENLKLKGDKSMAVKGNYRIAMVKYIQGYNASKEYAFALFNTNNDDVVIGDYVLCDTSQGYNVAKVTKIVSQSEYSGCTVTKEIICKVDFTEFEKRKELRKEKEALKKQMDKMVKDNQELFLYQALADKNPEMAEMLAKYRELRDV